MAVLATLLEDGEDVTIKGRRVGAGARGGRSVKEKHYGKGERGAEKLRAAVTHDSQSITETERSRAQAASCAGKEARESSNEGVSDADIRLTRKESGVYCNSKMREGTGDFNVTLLVLNYIWEKIPGAGSGRWISAHP